MFNDVATLIDIARSRSRARRASTEQLQAVRKDAAKPATTFWPGAASMRASWEPSSAFEPCSSQCSRGL